MKEEKLPKKRKRRRNKGRKKKKKKNGEEENEEDEGEEEDGDHRSSPYVALREKGKLTLVCNWFFDVGLFTDCRC